ncbi:MAG: hypothetical protein ABIQ53_17075 [Terracoccus sp.]
MTTPSSSRGRRRTTTMLRVLTGVAVAMVVTGFVTRTWFPVFYGAMLLVQWLWVLPRWRERGPGDGPPDPTRDGGNLVQEPGPLPRAWARWRSRLRQGAAHRRESRHRAGEEVKVPVLWLDLFGRELTEVPELTSGQFTVCVRGDELRRHSGQPLILGGFHDFWSNCLRQAGAGTLPTVADDEDIALAAEMPFPKGARAAIVMTRSDWDLVRQAHACRDGEG